VAPRRPRDADLARELARLARELDAVPALNPPEALVARTLALARAELARTRAPAAPLPPGARAALPAGFARELLRLLGLAAAPLTLALAWNAAVLALAWPLLSAALPEPLAVGLVVAYGFGALGWLALATASLPFAAHRKALARHPEVAA
jgi:hypothetical protein